LEAKESSDVKLCIIVPSWVSAQDNSPQRKKTQSLKWSVFCNFSKTFLAGFVVILLHASTACSFSILDNYGALKYGEVINGQSEVPTNMGRRINR
jgi:hypothetical protein